LFKVTIPEEFFSAFFNFFPFAGRYLLFQQGDSVIGVPGVITGFMAIGKGKSA